MDFHPVVEPRFANQAELDSLLDHLRRRRSSILGWHQTPAEIFREIYGASEPEPLLDTLFDEPVHVVERFLANPDCRLEEAFSDRYKQWLGIMLEYRPNTQKYVDDLGDYAIKALSMFLPYVVDHIPPYWSCDQYLLIHDMETRPLDQSPRSSTF